MNHLHIIPVGGIEPIHRAHPSCWCQPSPDRAAPGNYIHASKDGREHREARNLPTEPGAAWVTIEENSLPYDAGGNLSPSRGFALSRLALWSQHDRLEHIASDRLYAQVTRTGATLICTIWRPTDLFRSLRERRRNCQVLEDSAKVPTSIGDLWLYPVRMAPYYTYEVRLSIDLGKDITDEGWIKGFDKAIGEELP